MYHLLVKANGWNANRDTLDIARIFEYTDETIGDKLKSDSGFHITEIQKLPALFMTELYGEGPQYANLGYINRLVKRGREYQIDYEFETDVPKIPISDIERLAGDLLIQNFEFSRTHWAVKDVDLFKVLFHNNFTNIPKPKVFQFPNQNVENDLIAVMMPFDKKFDAVYDAIKRIKTNFNLKILRADDIWENDVIINDIVSLIWRARIVICDFTDRNANVFYESGIAHSIGKDVICISQSKNDIPFDLQHVRFLLYLNNSEGLNCLTTELEKRIETIFDSNKNKSAR